MLFSRIFGHKVFIDKDLVGYISPDGDMFSDGYKFGVLTEYGEIYIHDEYVGYIDDNDNIICDDINNGYVSPSNDLVFASLELIIKDKDND